MIEVNNHRTKTDEAWKRLYARLDADRLLADPERSRAVHRKHLLKWSALAAAMLAGFVCLASAWWLASGTAGYEPNLLTQENREASTLVTTLEDGSVVYLAQESTLQYPEHFAADNRQVNLQGEAYFDVAKKPRQTFLIETEQVRIEVLGTAFNVRSHNDGLFRLSVQRGRVKVSLKHGSQSVLANAGETVTLHAQQLQLSATRDTDAFGRYARNIRFKDECLEDILRIINAHAPGVQIQAGTPALGRRKLTIEFADCSPETAAELICWALSLKCTRQGDKLILSE